MGVAQRVLSSPWFIEKSWRRDLRKMAEKTNDDELRLLIVDDEEAARYGMRRALGGSGYLIEEAESAESARSLVKQ